MVFSPCTLPAPRSMDLPGDLPVFVTRGYTRLKCRVTSLSFWSKDKAKETCGDTEEDPYTFIGNPIITGFPERGTALKDRMRESFISFFEQRDHKRVEPYPVLARWRDDIHLTIASIADFQPHVTSGLVPPPANPLVISQPCIRLTDVASVGRSGRHLTTFEMMAHHAFNRPLEAEVHYWIEKCIEMCDDYLVKDLGIDPQSITYVENPWSGGGNAGPAVEVIVGGLELATLVYMNLEEDEEGPIGLKGSNWKEMPLQIIDTGYGLERFCWAAAGTPTIYDAIYPETVAYLKDACDWSGKMSALGNLDIERILSETSRLAGILNLDLGGDLSPLRHRLLVRLEEVGVSIDEPTLLAVTEPLEAIYGISDHLQALCMMLGDGLIPSNARAGYLARMIARRTLRLRDRIGISISLADLAIMHLDYHAPPLNTQTRDGIHEVLAGEEARYNTMLDRGQAAVRRVLSEIPKHVTQIDDDLLFGLNDSHGLPPETTIEIAQREGWSKLKVRAGIEAEIAQRHAEMARTRAKSSAAQSHLPVGHGHPATKRLDRVDAYATSTAAKVLGCYPIEDKYGIVLDQTVFYPEGGGQACDLGRLVADEFELEIIDCQSEGEIVLHIAQEKLEVGTSVFVQIDAMRRRKLMDHHTSVHIVGGAARKILGPHIFQAGANKSAEGARLDITHHKRLTRSDLDSIEALSNDVLLSVRTTEKLELSRATADQAYGFDLYQGGPPKGAVIRILKIAEHDIQACGGTHHDDLALIGQIRVLRSSSPSDGVERLHIVAGSAALEHARLQSQQLEEVALALAVDSQDLLKSCQRFFGEWKDQRKRIDALEGEIARLKTSSSVNESPVIDGVRIIIMETEGGLGELQRLSAELTRDESIPTVAVLGSRTGGAKLLIAVTDRTIASEKWDASVLLREISPHIGGGGGGSRIFAQGGGSNADGLSAALDSAKSFLGI